MMPGLLRFCIVLSSVLCLLELSFSAGNECKSIGKCGECIQTAGCVWCKDPKFTEPSNPNRGYARCNTLQQHLALGICNDEFLENPSPFLAIEESEETSKEGGAMLQLRPQSASMKLRVGDKVNITMEYFDTENKPLDLYYLMDLSATMADDKPKVATLGTTLATRIRSLTSNVTIGFGSFIDKPIAPFASVSQLNKQETVNTTAPYGFINHLPLTADIDRFQEEVKKAKISGNLDAPECGLDAVIQAVTCKDVIGWRSAARHLLILSTDGPFHIAGDGKLAGILLPNDCKCHMTKEDNYYTGSTSMDYPSVAQVNAKVKEAGVFLLFAVTEENVQLYERLSARIEGSATSALKEDSDNVVEIVEQEYKKIISSIEFPKLPPNIAKFIRLTYFAKCTTDSPFVKTNKCQDLKVGSNATFQVQVELIKCPRHAKDWKQILTVSPVGIREVLLVNLEMLCECPCESSIDEGYIENDPKLCEGMGTPRCGICDCVEGRRGRNCQCSSAGSDLLDIDDSGCQNGNSSTVCSSRGTCICGQCECNRDKDGNQIYSGPYCECDDGNCPIGENGLLCSGHGECKCGKCICEELFRGDSCGCSTQDVYCKEAGKDVTCSNRGRCTCGKCVCENPYSGSLCQNCPNCPGKCEDYELLTCIQCYLDHMNTGNREPCAECAYLSKIEDRDEVFEESDEEKSCTFHNEDGCETAFVYGFVRDDVNKLRVRLERTQRCPTDIPIIWIVLGIIGTVLLGGIILLFCWKFVLFLHDTRECKKFEKEIKTAKWKPGGNPIYKEATSTFRNPVYNNKT